MPVVDVRVREGSLSIEGSGERRAVVEVELTDGRVIERNLRARDAQAWADLLLSIGADVLAAVQEQDAEEGLDSAIDGPFKEATPDQRAVRGVRKLLELKGAYEDLKRAKDFFARVNQYRLDLGENVNQFKARLMAAGLTEEEWDEAYAVYQFLNQGTNESTIDAYDALAKNPIWTD